LAVFTHDHLYFTAWAGTPTLQAIKVKSGAIVSFSAIEIIEISANQKSTTREVHIV
jgi:hypothetical protein